MAEDRSSVGAASGRGLSDAQCAAVVAETDRILHHPAFQGSKRCVALLRYLVDHALAGNEDRIKERTLGIEVFGRSADYDANTDTIVRNTANEIRKRLAQCYQEPDCHYAAKIHLVRGSYLPEFEFAGNGRPAGSAATENLQPSPSPLPPHPLENSPSGGTCEPHPKFRRWTWSLGIAVVVMVAIAGSLLVRSPISSSPEYKMWKPLLESGNPIILCLSDRTPLMISGRKSGSQATDNVDDFLHTSPAIIVHGSTQDTAFADVDVAHAISMLLLGFRSKTNLQPASALTFQSFRRGPVVIVGGSNNPWTPILLSKMRYSIRIDSIALDKWIQDSQNPAMHAWKIEGKPLNKDNYYDYAVITRSRDKETGQWILALSGLEKHGTEAAGEFVTDPAFAKMIPSSIRPEGNFQIVLRTSVMRENTGPSEVIAVHTW